MIGIIKYLLNRNQINVCPKLELNDNKNLSIREAVREVCER